MFQALKNKAVAIALNGVKEKVVNPKLDGIGVVEEISFRDKELLLRVRLEGLEDHPIEVICHDIKIAPDGGSVRIGSFTANKKFAQAALDNFVAGRDFPIPEGAARMAAVAARKALDL